MRPDATPITLATTMSTTLQRRLGFALADATTGAVVVFIVPSLRWHYPDQVRRSKLGVASSQPGSPDSRVCMCGPIIAWGPNAFSASADAHDHLADVGPVHHVEERRGGVLDPLDDGLVVDELTRAHPGRDLRRKLLEVLVVAVHSEALQGQPTLDEVREVAR